MDIFLFWLSYIGGIISGVLVSVLIVLTLKNNPYLPEKIKRRMFSKGASVVDISNPVEDLEL